MKKLINKPACGALFAVFLLLLTEISLHTDTFLFKYRSVFAAGRLMDKLEAVNTLPVNLLALGNSRTDNGIDPIVIKQTTHDNAFNLGVPGANAAVLYAIVLRLKNQGLLGPNRIAKVLIGLDESIFDAEDSLGYRVFFADRFTLLGNGEYRAWLSTVFRLLGYGPQIKELREPEKLLQFVRASYQEIQPIGGSAILNYGYRPGEREKFQNDQQLLLQEAGTMKAPDPIIEGYLWKIIDLLKEQKVDITVFFPPLLNRDVLFLNPENPKSIPYIAISKKLQSMEIPILKPSQNVKFDVSEFANAGHLNKKGATRFSKMLGEWLLEITR